MIQIDMQMPKNCLDCPACNEYLMCAIPVNGRKWEENDVREFGQSRPEWCPMKEQKIAMKPKYIDNVGGNCPVCGVRMARNHKYCYQCGQEMDWK